MDYGNHSDFYDKPFDPVAVPPAVPPLHCPDFNELTQKINSAMEFCRLLEVRLENMQHHGTPTAQVYDFRSGKKLY
jgi:hypothetical protein